MPPIELQLTLMFGLLLTIALFVGWIGEWLRLPKVTAYLLVGVALGPSLLGLIEHEDEEQPARARYLRSALAGHPDATVSEKTIEKIAEQSAGLRVAELEAVVESADGRAAAAGGAMDDQRLWEAFQQVRADSPRPGKLFEPLTKLAIAMVLFILGCNFPLVRVRRFFRRVMRLSAGELGLTFALVAGGLMAIGENWDAAFLLGALALATAPATTILVLKEAESEGPVTEYTGALVAVNNFVCIVLFEVLFLAIHFIQGKLDVSPALELRQLLQDVAGSAALGIAGGLAVSYCFALVAASRRLVLLVAVLTLLLGAAEWMEMPYLLTFLAMGITVANTSSHTRQVLAELDWLTGLLCVVFFVAHGSELEVAKLAEAGWVGLAYVVFRTAGKYFGIRVASRAVREDLAVRRWLGSTLLAQAGAAIALSAIAARRDPELGRHILTVILGTVVVFEIIGPILIRQAVLRAGEVPLAHAIRHSTTELAEQLRAVWNRALVALGFDPWRKREPKDLTIHELMRKNIKGIPESATFGEVVAYIEHSRDNTYPVVNTTGHLVGVIRYRELSNVLFDREVSALVRAADVTTPAGHVLYPDDSLAHARELFEAGKDDCIPVVTRDKPRQLLGIIRRRDVLRTLIRGTGEGGTSH